MDKLSYKELQTKARELGIKTQQKKDILVELLAAAAAESTSDAAAPAEATTGASDEAAAAPAASAAAEAPAPAAAASAASTGGGGESAASRKVAASPVADADAPERKRQRVEWTESPAMPSPLPVIAAPPMPPQQQQQQPPPVAAYQPAPYQPAPIAPPMPLAAPPAGDGRVQGTCLRWVGERGFGFVSQDGGVPGVDVFCHSTAILDGAALVVGSRVSFVVDMRNPARPRAEQVMGGGLAPSAAAPVAPRGMPVAVTPGKLGGVVLRWNTKGFGFVRADLDQQEIFVHSSAILDGNMLPVGGRVEFVLSMENGRPRGEHCTGGIHQPRDGGAGGGGGGYGGYAPPQQQQQQQQQPHAYGAPAAYSGFGGGGQQIAYGMPQQQQQQMWGWMQQQAQQAQQAQQPLQQMQMAAQLQARQLQQQQQLAAAAAAAAAAPQYRVP